MSKKHRTLLSIEFALTAILVFEFYSASIQVFKWFETGVQGRKILCLI